MKLNMICVKLDKKYETYKHLKFAFLKTCNSSFAAVLLSGIGLSYYH